MSKWMFWIMIRNWFWPYRRSIGANFGCLSFVIVYSILGAMILLHFEKPHAEKTTQTMIEVKVSCVESIIHSYPKQNRTELAQLITDYCFIRANYDGRSIWNFKNAFLFGFGIITTLGYGLIEPMTINGRMFTVIFGFIGIPITVIMLTNFGRYLQNLEVYMSHRFFNNKTKNGEDSQETDELEQISMTLLFSTVFLYLVVGAIFIPIFNGQFDFFNGIYYAYLCLTALEFGELIPKENEKAIPIIILYIELGLAISTIALDLGSTYVRRLYYIGRKVHNLASIKIWFGAKELKLKELITALSQNMGLEESLFKQVNLEQLIADAIKVREGRLSRVPQTVMIVEGIWPPELVPLFLREGKFPEYADEDIETDSRQYYWNSNNNVLSQLSNSAIAGFLSDGRNNSLRKLTRKLSVVRMPSSSSTSSKEKKSVRFTNSNESGKLPSILEEPRILKRPFSISTDVKFIDAQQNNFNPSPDYF